MRRLTAFRVHAGAAVTAGNDEVQPKRADKAGKHVPAIGAVAATGKEGTSATGVSESPPKRGPLQAAHRFYLAPPPRRLRFNRTCSFRHGRIQGLGDWQ